MNKRREEVCKGLELSGNVANLETSKSFAWVELAFEKERLWGVR